MSVKIGDREVVIEPFKGYKGARGGRLFGRISRHWPEIADKMADFRRSYGEKHYRRITRTMAETRCIPEQVSAELAEELGEEQAAALQVRYVRTAEMYQRLLDGQLKTQDHVDLPESPSQAEEVAAVFGDVFEVAETELLELLALLVTPNHELKRAYKAGGEEKVDELLTETGMDLLFDADLQDLLALAVEGYEVLRKQLAIGTGGPVGKLLSLLGYEAPTTSASPPPAAATVETSSTSPSTSTSDDSSTVSPPPTDGERSAPSSALAGVSSPS